MTYSAFCIDGLGKPPASWYTLAREVGQLVYSIFLADRLNPDIADMMRYEISKGNRIIAIGHSLGGERIEQLAADRIDLHAAVLIDAVRSDWERRPFEVNATHAISFTRRWLLGLPPSMGLRVGDVKMNAGHNKIIAKATPQIVEFLRKAVGQ